MGAVLEILTAFYEEQKLADTRIEPDSMGELTAPATALYGAQRQRSHCQNGDN